MRRSSLFYYADVVAWLRKEFARTFSVDRRLGWMGRKFIKPCLGARLAKLPIEVLLLWAGSPFFMRIYTGTAIGCDYGAEGLCFCSNILFRSI